MLTEQSPGDVCSGVEETEAGSRKAMLQLVTWIQLQMTGIRDDAHSWCSLQQQHTQWSVKLTVLVKVCY